MCLLLTAWAACVSVCACVCVWRKMKEKCRLFSIIKRELHCRAPKACEKLNSTILLSTMALLAVQMGLHPPLGLRALLLGCCAVFSTYWSLLASVSHQKIGDTISNPVQLAPRTMFYFPLFRKQPQPEPLFSFLWGLLGLIVHNWQF